MRESRRKIEFLTEAEVARGEEKLHARMQPEKRERDPKVFASNLDRLTIMHGLTRKEAADKFGADYLWYRRAVSKGLRRITTDTQEILERIIREFGVNRVEDLWEPNLIRFEANGGFSGDGKDSHTNLVWRQKEWWPWARKLAHILATGKHDYLRDLIDAVYQTIPPDSYQEPEDDASFWSSSPDDDDDTWRDHDRIGGK